MICFFFNPSAVIFLVFLYTKSRWRDYMNFSQMIPSFDLKSLVVLFWSQEGDFATIQIVCPSGKVTFLWLLPSLQTSSWYFRTPGDLFSIIVISASFQGERISMEITWSPVSCISWGLWTCTNLPNIWQADCERSVDLFWNQRSVYWSFSKKVLILLA